MNSSFVDHASPLVDGWDAESLRRSDEWRFSLTDDAIDEIRSHLERNGGELSDRILDTEFPTLAEAAQRIRGQLGEGFGLAWVSPGDPDSAEDGELSALFSVICSLLGMAHRTVEPPTPIIDLEPGLVTVHLDGLVPDVVGSICMHPGDSASPGGSGHTVLLCSAAASHDRLAESPEKLKQLYRPVLQDMLGERWLEAPIYRYEPRSRSLEFRYDRRRMEHAQASAQLSLADAFRDALDDLDRALRAPELHASIHPGRGDIVLVNNRRVATAGIVNAVPPNVVVEIRGLRVVNPLIVSIPG